MHDWITPDWPVPRHIVAVSTTRTGGVSRGSFRSLNLGAHVEDEAAAVATNRQRLRKALELEQEPAWLDQVHGINVVDAAHKQESPPTADASFSTTPGIACVVMTADCLPVLFAARNDLAVAAAHAGWRGLAGGVLEATLEALPVAPGEVLAWLGPAISQSAFEVGAEVRAAFLEADPSAGKHFERNARGRFQADLYGLARQRLANAGVCAIYGGGWCTYGDSARFFSYRRDSGGGRMATLVAIRPAAAASKP